MASGAKILTSAAIAVADATPAPFYFSPQAATLSLLLVFLDGGGNPIDGSAGVRDLIVRAPDSTGRFVTMTLGIETAFPGDSWTAVAVLGAVQALEIESAEVFSPPGAVSYRYELLLPEKD